MVNEQLPTDTEQPPPEVVPEHPQPSPLITSLTVFGFPSLQGAPGFPGKAALLTR